MIITLPAASLLRLYPFVSREETRYLNGISISKHSNGVVLVATNGHTLGVWQEENVLIEGAWPDGSIIVAIEGWVKGILERKPDFSLTAYAIVDTEARTLSVGSAPAKLCDGTPTPKITIHDALIDGTFPAWRTVIPPVDNLKPFPFSATVGFRPEYLGDFRAVKPDVPISIFGDEKNSGDGPAIVLLGSTPQFVGVVMPMKSHIKMDAPAPIIA